MSSTLDNEFSGEPPSAEIAAAEHVLGVTDAQQRAATAERIRADAAFATLVAGWEQRLAPLAQAIPPEPVPARVWRRVRASLGWDEPAPAQSSHAGAWRWATVLASAVAITAVVWNLYSQQRVTTAPPTTTAIVTALAHTDGSTAWLAVLNTAQGRVQMVPAPNAAQTQGQAAELWLIVPGQAPRSLGGVSVTQPYTVEVPQELRAQLRSGATLAITLESPVGLPHAKPAGPIVASGMIS